MTSNVPTGTVTFLFTDIEGSTSLAREYPDAWESMHDRHNSILRGAVESHHGFIFETLGDAFCMAFHNVRDGLNAAIEAQRQLQNEDWENTPIKVRMGLHTGSAELIDNDYRGYLTMAKVQRVMSVAYGGQILLSNASAELIKNELHNGITLRDMKEHRLKEFSDPEHLWQIVAADLQQDFPPLQSLVEIPNNLPLQLSTFIGREKEVGQIKKRIEKNRLMTLTGSGGVGKTRLSIQVATELMTEYPNGVWLVELAPITDPALVTQTMCATLNVTPRDNTPALTVLKDFLKQKKALLVMDNCEHLIDTCAQICDSLLQVCPNLHIIVSSREALGLDSENIYHVPSLSLPDNQSGLAAIKESDAVKLFMERATAVLSEFELAESNALFIVQICKRLDGIALAIELAASRVKLLKVEQIASRLDDAFRLLTGGSRTALPRQQTLRALIEWSHNLLSEPEKILFRRLAIFASGWTMEAAEFVCSGDGIESEEVLDLMAHLVDKSLVVIVYEGTESRYRMLETIRQYGREKLAESGESETLRNRHMKFFCQLVERIEQGLRGPDQVSLMDGLENELDNLRTALEWSLDHNVSAGTRLASQLKWFWHIRDHENEGVNWLDKFLIEETEYLSIKSNLALSVFDQVKALQVLAYLAGNLGKIQKATLCATESLVLCEKIGGTEGGLLIAESYHLVGSVAVLSGDLGRAKTLAEKSLVSYQRIGDKFGMAEVQSNLLLVIALRSGALENAHILSDSNLAIRYEIGDKDGITYGLHLGGLVAMHQKDYERAQKLFLAAIDASQLGRSDYVLGLSLSDLGIVYLLKGEVGQAREYFLQVAKLAKWFHIHKALSICVLALYNFEKKQYRKFILLMGFLKSKNPLAIYLYLHPMIEMILQKNIVVAQEALGEESFKQAESEGKAMTLDQAFDYGLEEFDE